VSALHRLAPLSGLAGIGCVVAGLAMDAAPTSRWSDARITDWYANHGSAHWFLSAYLLALGAPLLLIFAAVVRDRLARAGASHLAGSIAHGAGAAFAVTILVGAGIYAAIPAAMTFAKSPAPSADVSRYLLGASYGVLVMFSAFAAALLVATVSITALRHRVLPRWLAIIGVPTSLLMLANAAIPMGFITLWFVAASIALTVRTAPAAPAVSSHAAIPAFAA
jgi:hypothetical protein